MDWETRYLPCNEDIWHGRIDAPAHSSVFQQVKIIDLLKHNRPLFASPGFALLGFQCDEGAARDLRRVGAVEAPRAIRRRLANLSLHLKNPINLYDVGNILCTDHDLESSQKALAQVTNMLLDQGITPIIIGGGHEVVYGHYLGLTPHIKPKTMLGIVSFDAHFDLHPLAPSHRASATTAFYQIAKDMELKQHACGYACIGIQTYANTPSLFEVAQQLHVPYLLADDIHLQNQPMITTFCDAIIEQYKTLALSLSLDVFAPAFAPGVSTIQPLGLTPWQVIPLLRHFIRSGKVRSYDLSEHVPRYDIDHRTAKLAATLICDIMHHHSLE